MQPISVITALILSSLLHWECFSKTFHALSHVEKYNVIRLQNLGSRSISNQAPENYPEILHYQLFLDGNSQTINLEKNRLLVGHNYTEIFYKEDGSIMNTSPRLQDHCYYHGHIEGMEDSSVSVGVCSGMRGFVRAGQQLYLIEPLSNSTEGDHVLYKQEDLRRNKRQTNIAVYDHEPKVAALFKSSSWKSSSAFHTRRYVELFLVVDNTEYKYFGSDTGAVRARMLEAINHVDKLYHPHNIRVMLVGLEVWTGEDQIAVSESSDDTLTKFIEWRQNNLLKRVKHDNAQFVTGIDFLGETVGLANKYAMCAVGSGGVNQDHNIDPLGLAATIAHEMGHNMGMSHDGSHCSCGSLNTDCIMTERVGTRNFPQLFSDCSLDELSVFLENANPSCLLDLPHSDRLYEGSVCGNTFLDPGEECDCGSKEECKNPCCDPKTCTFTEGSQCAEGDCCENCQIKQAGSVCRAAASDCDLAEYCTGLSEKCPEDGFKMNGLPCGSGSSYCYNGQCPTHLQHCRRLWGKDANVASDACFFKNTFGHSDSHCGRTKDGFKPCAIQDIHCGSIFCTGGNTLPVTGLKATVQIKDQICNIVGERFEEDKLSMVPTGTKCGSNKVCFENVCQDLKVYGVSEDCSSKCSGHGICNHQKQCHCEPGWAPPYCDIRYTDLHSRKAAIISVSATVGVLLLLAVALGSWTYFRRTKNTRSSQKMKPLSNGEQSNPLTENTGDKRRIFKDRPQISQPTFIESSVTQSCAPLTVQIIPRRPPPQPPENTERQPRPSPVSITSATQMKSMPPAKPLCPLDIKQVSRSAHPPAPPLKPVVVSGSWRKQQNAEDEVKFALRPPTMPRR